MSFSPLVRRSEHRPWLVQEACHPPVLIGSRGEGREGAGNGLGEDTSTVRRDWTETGRGSLPGRKLTPDMDPEAP